PLILRAEVRHGESNTHLASYGRQANKLLPPIKRVGVNIVPGRTDLTLRTFHGLESGNWIALFLGFFNLLGIGSFVFLLPSKGGCQSFSSLNAGLNEQVAYQF